MREILQQHKFDGGILEKPDEKGEVLTKINSDYYDKSSPHFGDNERFTWAVNKVYERYNSAQTVYELVTMTEFVFMSEPQDYACIVQYAIFITQPLTEEMFIGDGRIFEGWEIVDFGKWTKRNHIYGKWITNCEEHLFSECSERWCLIGRNRTIEQALNNGVKIFWNGNTI